MKKATVSEYDLIVVGDGVGARTFLYYLSKQSLTLSRPLKILQLFENKLFPPSSLSAGALVSSFGAQRGLSALGDLNVECFEQFSSFINEYNLYDVAKKIEMNFFKAVRDSAAASTQNFLQRWSHKKIQKDKMYLSIREAAFIINPYDYLNYLEMHYLKNEKIWIEKRVGFVSSVEEKKNEVLVQSGAHLFNTQKILLFSGAYTSLLEVSLEMPELRKYTSVFGGYIHIPKKMYDTSVMKLPQALNVEGINILIDERGITIGATTQTFGPWIIDFKVVDKWKPIVDQLIKHLGLEEINWNAIEIVSGIRSKGKKRMPQMQWTSDRIFYGTHFYKNGFMYALKSAKLASANISFCD